ncbi:hypothetical protein ACXYMU_04140 [Pontibacter sp. CAU 1760]
MGRPAAGWLRDNGECLMKARRLYGDAGQIAALLQQMELQETAAGGYAAVYRHPDTGAFWLQCYATAAVQGGGYQLLIKLPLPSTDKLIEVALQSAHTDEAVAALFRLLDEEALEKKDFRQELVQHLERLAEEPLNAFTRQRVEEVIRLTALDDPMNKREVLHKSQAEIAQDAAEFEQIAQWAKALLRRIRE